MPWTFKYMENSMETIVVARLINETCWSETRPKHLIASLRRDRVFNISLANDVGIASKPSQRITNNVTSMYCYKHDASQNAHVGKNQAVPAPQPVLRLYVYAVNKFNLSIKQTIQQRAPLVKHNNYLHSDWPIIGQYLK